MESQIANANLRSGDAEFICDPAFACSRLGVAVAELRVPLADASAVAVEEAVTELAEGTWMVLEDNATGASALVGYFPSREKGLKAWEIIEAAIRGLGVTAVPETRDLADTDWRESYKAHFKPWRCGRVHWVPAWERGAYEVPEGDVAIWLDPGMAFGTGNHETTRLCCERLVAFADARGTDVRVIDAGCGSGILALTAARLGFRDVQGFDNDPEAIAVSSENAESNGLAGSVVFTVDDIESGLRGKTAGLVMANIQADVLIRFASLLVNAIERGGALILSGILATEIDAVKSAIEAGAPGWMQESRVLGEWCDFCITRPR